MPFMGVGGSVSDTLGVCCRVHCRYLAAVGQELGAGVLSSVGRHGVTSVRGGLVNRGRGGGGAGNLILGPGTHVSP